ncbi:hypothetical protein SLE2022_050380 [Rubroshorea leprosula]
MFDIFFGWRKASRCKKLIKQVQCRLKLLKNKKHTIVKQLREDMAELIKLGHEESAFNRVEQLFKDENTISVYDMLDRYCEFLTINLSYIRRNKDCPNDINEAVSTLIFASARCGDLPELPSIRKLFGERYGQGFATGAIESYPGNLVNREVKEKLSIKTVPDDAKDRLVDEIIRQHCLRPELLAIEYPLEPQHQDKENIIEESPVQNSDIIEIEEESMDVVLTSMTNSHLSEPFQSQSLQSLDAIRASVTCSIVQPSSPDVTESLVLNKEEKGENFEEDSGFESEVGSAVDTESRGNDRNNVTSTLKHKDKRLEAVSSSESLKQFFGEKVVYHDDTDEIQSSVTKEGGSQDQRIFKFKSPIPRKTGGIISEFSDGGSGMDHYEEVSEISGSSNSRKSNNADRKRSRRRSISRESSTMQDTDHEIYYEKPSSHKHRSHRRKLQKNATVEEQSTYGQKLMKQHGCADKCKYNAEKPCVCRLEDPYYFSAGDKKDEEQAPQRKQNRGLKNMGQFPFRDFEENSSDSFSQSSQYGGSSNEMEWTKVEQTVLPKNLRSRRSYANGESVYVVYTWPPNKQREKTEKKQSLPSYLRAMTMPQERPKNSQKDSILRSISCNLPHPNHVHPKLPDCDEITAKFMALKKDYKQNKP